MTKKNLKSLMCIMLTAVIISVAVLPAEAASASGTINGSNVNASLIVGSASDASTTSSLNAYHRVEATVYYYYMVGDTPYYKSNTSKESNNQSVYVTVNPNYPSNAINRIVQGGSSYHYVEQSGSNWSVSLTEP